MEHPYVDFHSRGSSNVERTSLEARRGHATFNLSASIVSVGGTTFGTQLEQQIEAWLLSRRNRSQHVRDPAELAYARFLPVLEELVPESQLVDLSLKSFLHAPLWDLWLEATGDGDEVIVKGQDNCTYAPNFAVAPMPTAELPDVCKDLPHYRAEREGADVRWEGKPRLDLREPDFKRELIVLSRIKSAGLAARLRVPELYGIVVAGEHGETMMGMLMTFIVSSKAGEHLQSPYFHDKIMLHAKWEEQVSAIVHDLHTHDLVWGDVNPMNVAIDEGLDAWVIDFGGMNNVEFVDDANRETEEGDWQGIRRLFKEWLPARAAECSKE